MDLAELICSEEFENLDPETNYHEADLEKLFDDEPRVQSAQKQMEEKTDQQETEPKRRETDDIEWTEEQELQFHVDKYLGAAVVAYKVLPTRDDDNVSVSWK